MRDTIDMARKAGVRSADGYKLTVSHMSIDTLKRLEALVRADAIAGEREACAKVCDELHWPWRMGDNSGPKECAAAIRARGEASKIGETK